LASTSWRPTRTTTEGESSHPPAGAREVSVTLADDEVRSAAAGLGAARLEVTVARSGGVGEPVTVTVGYSMEAQVPFVAWLFLSTVGLSVNSIVRQEVDPV